MISQAIKKSEGGPPSRIIPPLKTQKELSLNSTYKIIEMQAAILYL